MTFMPGWLYKEVYGAYIPRLCVDVIVQHTSLGIALTKRSIPPVGWWHLPGGLAYRGETLAQVAARIVKQDLGQVLAFRQVGVIETGEMDHQVMIDGRQVPMKVYAVMIEMLATTDDETLCGEEESRWFTKVPDGEYDPAQIKFLLDNGLLQ